MRNVREIISFYFDCLWAAGESPNFEFVEIQNGQIIKTHFFDHRHYDGISTIVHLAKQKKSKLTFPKLKMQPPPPLHKRLWYFLQWSVQAQTKRMPARELISSGKAAQAFTCINLTPEQKQDKKLNAKLLRALHETFSKEGMKTLWMVPVSMYEDHELNMDLIPGNKVSFLDIEVNDKKSSDDLHQEISSQLKAGIYWGTIYSIYTPKLIGKKIFIKLLPYFSKMLQRTGTFSNVGDWQMEALPEDTFIGIRSTVVAMNPVAATALTINGKLSLSLNFHPTMGKSDDEVRVLLQKWAEKVSLVHKH